MSITRRCNTKKGQRDWNTCVLWWKGQVQMTRSLPGSRRRCETSLETIVGNNSCRLELESYTSFFRLDWTASLSTQCPPFRIRHCTKVHEKRRLHVGLKIWNKFYVGVGYLVLGPVPPHTPAQSVLFFALLGTEECFCVAVICDSVVQDV